MNKINLFLAIFSCNFISAQNKNIEQNFKRNVISIEFYGPIENSLPEFYNFNYGFGNSTNLGINNYSKNKLSNSFGISYERICDNNIIFRPRIGLSITNTNENQLNEDFEPNPTEYSKEYTYKQTNLNYFIGIAKRINLAKKITLDLGLDLASIYYSKGSGNYKSVQTQKYLNTGDVFKQEINVTSEMGKVYSFGIGPYLKPEIILFTNFTLSFEMQVYFLKTISDEQSSQLEISDKYLNGVNFEHIELNTIVNNDLKFWEWTKVSPLLRFGYKF
jgi:hypothetical protein